MAKCARWVRRVVVLGLAALLLLPVFASWSATEDDAKQQAENEAMLTALSLMCGGSTFGGRVSVPPASTVASSGSASVPPTNPVSDPPCAGGSGGCAAMDPQEVQRVTRDAGSGDGTDIPPEAFAAYCSAAGAYEMDWTVLAAVGWAECRHGRGRDPGCNPRGSVNSAGARGPMQHVGNVWDKTKAKMDPDVRTRPIPRGRETAANGGFATDGNGDGWADPWDWPDATHGAAREIRHYYEQYDDWDLALQTYNGGYAHQRSSAAVAYRQSVNRLADDYRQKTAHLGAGSVPRSADCRVEGSTTPISDSRLTAKMRVAMGAVTRCFGRGRYGFGCWAERSWGDHPQGRACDFMMATGRMPDAFHLEQGWRIANYLKANAEALHVKYIIWQDLIWVHGEDTDWREYYCPGGGRDCGNITLDHYDHVHLSVDP
jgi:hypothetical protein